MEHTRQDQLVGEAKVFPKQSTQRLAATKILDHRQTKMKGRRKTEKRIRNKVLGKDRMTTAVVVMMATMVMVVMRGVELQLRHFR
jgi:hypothetical protein